jgi:hypothetical protein
VPCGVNGRRAGKRRGTDPGRRGIVRIAVRSGELPLDGISAIGGGCEVLLLAQPLIQTSAQAAPSDDATSSQRGQPRTLTLLITASARGNGLAGEPRCKPLALDRDVMHYQTFHHGLFL